MKLSNLRTKTRENKAYLVCDTECTFSKAKEIWFSVPIEYERMLTDTNYDAFLIAALYPAMYYNEPIIIDGLVSQKLYRNVICQVQAIITDFATTLKNEDKNSFHKIDITVKGFINHMEKGTLVGAPFSAGIDSFTTIIDHLEKEPNEEYRINTFFFFNVGSHGGKRTKEVQTRFENRFKYLSTYPHQKEIPFILMDSNLFDFYKPHWEYDAGDLLRGAGALVFEKVMRLYYAPSANTYKAMLETGRLEVNLDEYSSPYLYPLLSTAGTYGGEWGGLEIISDGHQYTRTQKTSKVADYAPARTILNVCVQTSEKTQTAENCSICSKCLRTLLTLESLGKLNDFSTVFDIRLYKKYAFAYKCEQRLLYRTSVFAKENVDLALQNGNPIPPYFIAVIVKLPYLLKRTAIRGVRFLLGSRYSNIKKRVLGK